jgi:hypothetical protein
MHTSLKLAIIGATGVLLGMAATLPASAQYQGPRGGYDSLSDYSRSVEGTPCGMNCTRRAQQRWARPYRSNPNNYNAYYNYYYSR